MNRNHYCVIMAGGIGSRFWPLSREQKPKQFVDALGIGQTFIQMTYARFSSLVPKENFLVVTGSAYKELVLEQLPELNPAQILTEPCRRNTAPCIAYAMHKIRALNPHAMVVVTPSDQFIGNEESFVRVVAESLEFAKGNEVLMTVGIAPTYPATGYGYIQCEMNPEGFSPVKRFKEKPDYQTAVRYLSSGEFYWNSGMFIWSVDAIIKALDKYLPQVASLFDGLPYNAEEEQEAVNFAFTTCESISIDYGVMEKAGNVYVRCTNDLAWSDVGSWGALYGLLEKDDSDNSLSGGDGFIVSRSDHNLIKETNPNKRVIIDGLRNFLVADTDDVLMICPLDNEERIKKIIAEANKTSVS